MKHTSRIQSSDAGSSEPRNLYEVVTRQLLTLMAEGKCPWRKPWQTIGTGLPINAVSKREYRGANTWLLGSMPFNDNRWLSFRQARELGGSVRKGERASIAVFWKLLDSKDEPNGTEKGHERIPLLRYYSVFNAEQCDGLNLPPIVNAVKHDRIQAADALVSAMPHRPAITECGAEAWYMPSTDRVNVPPLYCFHSPDAYYATLLHELGHATGHERRLGRKEVNHVARFGSAEYSVEELVAELSSAYICASLGLDASLIENSAAYLQGWIAALNNDPRMFVLAAGRAQRAADFIMGRAEPATDQAN
jgi:antirestriction protein ArdC